MKSMRNRIERGHHELAYDVSIPQINKWMWFLPDFVGRGVASQLDIKRFIKNDLEAELV